MKKNRKAGYNGALRAGIDKRGGYNLGGNLNIKEGKFNFFVSANINHRKSISPGTTDRLTFISDPEYQLNQVDSSVNSSQFAFVRGGLDYFMDNRNTFSISGTIVHGISKPYTNSNISQDTLYSDGYSTNSFTQRYSHTNTDFNNKSGMFSFKHNCPRSGENWTSDLNYTHGKTSSTNQTTSYLYEVPEDPLSDIYNQQQISSGDNEFITAQTDFVNPFTEKSKLNRCADCGAGISVT
jgi:hypothetical protein